MKKEIGRELTLEEIEVVTGGSLVVDFHVDDGSGTPPPPPPPEEQS